MAEISKYTTKTVGRLFLHNNRREDDGVTHSNENIDLNLTHLNYHFKEGGYDLFKQRLNEVYHMDRENLITLAEVIVTLPRDVRLEDERKFFTSVYNFYVRDFMEKNIINAVVHKDEITPHIHIDFVPAIEINRDSLSPVMLERIANYGKEHGIEVDSNLCAKELLDRTYFQKMHPRLLEWVTNDLGYTCEILNGATANGNKTILELKNRTLERELELKQNKLDSINQNVTFITRQIENMGLNKEYFSSTEILMRLDFVTKERDLLRQIVAENNLPLPQVAMEELLDQSNILKEGHFRVTYDDIIPNTGVVVIETYKEIPRIPPMHRLIEEYPELTDAINREPKKIELLKCNNGEFLVFPTDNIEDTFHNMVAMRDISRQLRHKKIIFPHISNDRLNIGETILRQYSFETEYHLKKESEDRQRTMVRMRGEE